MSELTEGGLDTEAPGTFPLDDVIVKAVEAPRMKALLNPFPIPRGGGSSGSGLKRNSESQMLSDFRSENKKLRMNSNSNSNKAKGVGGKAKGKGGKGNKGQKSKPSQIRIPNELLGLKKEFDGKNFCYAFNLEGCNEGSGCPKGVHRCMKCGSSNHGFRQCKE